MMGGVGDYSGSFVLEVATHVATTVEASLLAGGAAAAAGGDTVELISTDFGTAHVDLAPLRAAVAGGHHGGLSLPSIAEFLRDSGAAFWTFYVYGSLAVFVRETGWLPARAAAGGPCLRLSVTSDVPTAQGVSSSASVEVATIRALSGLSGTPLTQLRIAHIAQNAENHVVGAPCGLMDQLASACGTAGRVLPILCRPDILSEPVPLPAGVALVGWPSGVKHSVGASPYMVARAATFMGKKMAEGLLGRTFKFAAEITPWELHSKLEGALPVAILGADFLAAHGGVDDALSKIDPAASYPVRAALSFPIEENFRCGVAKSLLEALTTAAPGSPAYVTLLSQIGEMMRLTHAGYTAIGLGCDETDAMVTKLTAMGPAAGIYGARVSGGGSGGTIAVLLEKSAIPALEALAHEMTFGEPFPGLIQ